MQQLFVVSCGLSTELSGILLRRFVANHLAYTHTKRPRPSAKDRALKLHPMLYHLSPTASALPENGSIHCLSLSKNSSQENTVDLASLVHTFPTNPKTS